MSISGCCPGEKSVNDDITKILIFGATGMIGRAVALSAVASPFLEVYGFTRRPEIESFAETNLRVLGVEYVIGNMLAYETVLEATKSMDVVFLNTFFWETMSSKIEYTQGYNVVNAAVASGVKHLIYCTTDYNILNNYECPLFEAKARLSNYIVYTGIPYTLVRISWCYENFLSVFRPHPTSKKDFAIALPMGTNGLNMGCLKDFARCITLIALRPVKTINRTIDLCTTYLTVQQIAEIMNNTFLYYKFFDPQISLKEYQRLDFSGAKELTAMFHHYQTQSAWDTQSMTKYDFTPIIFEEWVVKFKQEFKQILEEQIVENAHYLEVSKSPIQRAFPTVLKKVERITKEKWNKIAYNLQDFLSPWLGTKETQV